MKYPTLYPGDIAGVHGTGLLPRLAYELFEPHTFLYHWFIIDEYIPDEDDYIIYESIPKGIAVGRLSFYKPDELVIYRKNTRPGMGKLAVLELTKLGRAGYDYWLYVKMAADVIRLLFSGHLPPWQPGDLRYAANSWFVCTEAANYGWEKICEPIITPGELPMGAGFIKAVNQGVLSRVYPDID